MTLYSKKDFATKCNIETKNLSVYITRKKVICLGDGMIDDADPRNALFLEKRKSKTETTETAEEEIPLTDTEDVGETTVIQLKRPKKSANTGENEENIDENASLSALDKRKTLLEVQKKEADLEKVRLQNAKLKGEVIPFGLMNPLIAQNNQSIVTEFKNAGDELILEISKKKTLSGEEVAYLTGKLVYLINDAVRKAQDQTIKSLDLIIKDYKATIK